MAYINGNQVLLSTEVSGLSLIDNELSRKSENPVTNKVITNTLNECSNAIKKSVSGAVLKIDDVSPVTHFIDCEVKSKNLCSIGSTGDFVRSKSVKFNDTLPAGVYSFSAVVESTDTDAALCLFSFTLDGGSKKPVTIARSANGARVKIENISIPSSFNGITFYAATSNANSAGDTASFTDIQIEAGTAATDYTPYVDITTIAVERFGKNLFPVANVECTPNENNNNVSYNKVDFGYTLPAGVYSFSAVVESTDTDATQCILALIADNEAQQYVLFERSTNGARVAIENVSIQSNIDSIMFYASNSSENSKDDTASFTDVQIEAGETATDYEAYIDVAISTPNASGGIDEITTAYPNMTVLPNATGVVVSVKYNRDLNKAFEELQNAILSLGGNI